MSSSFLQALLFFSVPSLRCTKTNRPFPLLICFKCVNWASCMAPAWWSIVLLALFYNLQNALIICCGKLCFASSKFTLPTLIPISSTLHSSRSSRHFLSLYDSLLTLMPISYMASLTSCTLVWLPLSTFAMIVPFGTRMMVAMLLTCIVTTSVLIVLSSLPAHYLLSVTPYIPSNLPACLFYPFFRLPSLLLPFRFKPLYLIAWTFFLRNPPFLLCLHYGIFLITRVFRRNIVLIRS